MASQITHVTYGQLVLGKFLKGKKDLNQRDFFIGTLFPDIRYRAKLDKKGTHVLVESPLSLTNRLSSFQTGLYAHCLVDFEREDVVEKLGFYKLFAKDIFTSYAMKFVEDEFTYRRFADWEGIKGYLNYIVDEERKYTSEKIIKDWHRGLQDYFSESPNQKTTRALAELAYIPSDIIIRSEKRTKEIKMSGLAMKIIEVTQSHLFQLFK